MLLDSGKLPMHPWFCQVSCNTFGRVWQTTPLLTILSLKPIVGKSCNNYILVNLIFLSHLLPYGKYNTLEYSKVKCYDETRALTDIYLHGVRISNKHFWLVGCPYAY